MTLGPPSSQLLPYSLLLRWHSIINVWRSRKQEGLRENYENKSEERKKERQGPKMSISEFLGILPFFWQIGSLNNLVITYV